METSTTLACTTPASISTPLTSTPSTDGAGVLTHASSEMGQPGGPLTLCDIMNELRSQRSELGSLRSTIVNRLDGIDTMLAAVTNQVSSIEGKLAKTDRELGTQTERMDEAEQRISRLEDSLATAEKSIKEAEKTNAVLARTVESLMVKTDDIIDRGKRKNLILLHLPEDIEGSEPLLSYVQKKLPTWLNLSLERPLELERVHRSLQEKPTVGKPPRPVYIRFLRFTDRELVLQSVKDASPIREGQATLVIHRDLSEGTRRKRREFNEAIQVFISKGIFRGFAHPAKLRILYSNRIKLLETPKDAVDFIERQGWDMPVPTGSD